MSPCVVAAVPLVLVGGVFAFTGRRRPRGGQEVKHTSQMNTGVPCPVRWFHVLVWPVLS